MEEARIIALKESVLADNDQDAQSLRDELRGRGTCLLNLMSSPGSGKTTTLLALNKAFAGRLRWGVMEADIDSAVDANTMLRAGVPSVQLHTGGMCHLDADMTRQGIREFGTEDLDLVILFYNPVVIDTKEPDIHAIVKRCDQYTIPVATNIATAEVLIHGLERGDLDWRNILK